MGGSEGKDVLGADFAREPSETSKTTEKVLNASRRTGERWSQGEDVYCGGGVLGMLWAGNG